MLYTVGSTVLDGWKIVRLIGEGAYGKVFEIEKSIDSYGLTTHSALKVIQIPQSQGDIRSALSEGMDEHTVTSQFRSYVDEIVHEIAVMSTLKSHPNIVSYEDHYIHEYPGEIRWDILIRMELLTPLIEYQMANTIDTAEILRMGRELCDALAFCQRKGLIHRDIKPENIFVSETGQFKLGDFGVSRTVEKTTGGMSKKGTESYMAPEVYLGQPYGSSVDIYSLGLVLYRFYNGNRLPFFPPAPQPISFSDRENALIRRMRGDTFPPPAKADERMAAIILKACAHQSSDRYRSAAEMAQALGVYVNSPAEEVHETPNVEHIRDDSEDVTLGNQTEQTWDHTVGQRGTGPQHDSAKDGDKTVGAWEIGARNDSVNDGAGGGIRSEYVSPFSDGAAPSTMETDPLDETFGSWGRSQNTQSEPDKTPEPDKKTALPALDIREFWKKRLPGIQTRAFKLNVPLTQEKVSKAVTQMSTFLVNKYAKRVSMPLYGEELDDLCNQLQPDCVVGLLSPKTTFSRDYMGMIVTEEALYINTAGKDGALVIRYRDIRDVKTVKGAVFGNQKLKVLLKDDSIRLCSPDTGGYDVANYINFDKLTEALLELREYYQAAQR